MMEKVLLKNNIYKKIDYTQYNLIIFIISDG